MSKILVFCFLLAGMCFLACNNDGDKSADNTPKAYKPKPIVLPAPKPLEAAEMQRIKNVCSNWFDTVLSLKGFSGGILVAKNGHIVYEQYSGSKNLDGVSPITDTTPLHIASVSKTFTAMAILKLWQEGRLNIDEEIKKYFPTFNYPGVTIKTLLNHRSGLPNYTHFMEQIGWDITKFVSNEDVLNTLITQKDKLPPPYPPDTHFAYCNTNYALLALIVERVTKVSFGDYLQQHIFEPLGMKHTFVFKLADTAHVAKSFDWKGRYMPFNFLDAVYGDKNLYTTPKDLFLWDRLLKSNLMFTQAILDKAYAPYSNEKPGVKNYGLGWRMNIYPDGKKMIFHNGWWHGSNAVFIRLLAEDATVICIGNKFNRSIYGTKVLCNLFGDYFLPEEDENENSPIVDSSQLKIGNLPKGKLTRRNALSKADSALQEKFRDKNKVY